MKKFLRLSTLALCVALTAIIFVGCGSTKITNDVNFGYYPAGEEADATSVTPTKDGNKFVVSVPADADNLEINIKPFLDKNNKVLGNDFSFTRSDVNGTGYAYVMVEDVGSAENNTYKKYGAADSTAVARKNLPSTPKLYVATTASKICLYINPNESGYPAAGKTVKFTFNGDNGETYVLEVVVKGVA